MTKTAPKKSSVEKSRFRGVFKCGSHWKAQYQRGGKLHYLGVHDSEEDAAMEYDRSLLEHHGNPLRTNFTVNGAERRPQSLKLATQRNQEARTNWSKLHQVRVLLGCNERSQEAVVTTINYHERSHDDDNSASSSLRSVGCTPLTRLHCEHQLLDTLHEKLAKTLLA